MSVAVETLLIGLSAAIENAASSLSIMPAAENSFRMIANELRASASILQTQELSNYLLGVHPEQNVINLINRMNGKPEEDLSLYAVQKRSKPYDYIKPHISFEEIKERATHNPKYIVTENYIERLYVCENKYWYYKKKLVLSKNGITCKPLVLNFLDKPLSIINSIYSYEEYEEFYKDLGVRCITAELGGSLEMLKYIEKYSKTNSPTEEDYVNGRYYY